MKITKQALVEEARRVMEVEAAALVAMAGRLDADRFVQAVEIIRQCRGRVIVTGMGKSGLIGKKIAATLASTGTPAFSLHPGEACHGDLGMVTEHDVVLALSNSGETEEVVALIPFLKRFAVKLVTLTGKSDSTLALAANVNLDVSVAEEACSLGIVPTSSTTATLAMGDAIAVALLKSRGFREEDFATFHPKGSLGKKLLTTVADLMHTGPTVPRVSPQTPMTETVLEISSKRLGFATVVDEANRLLGVITDGDLRRGIGEFGPDLYRKSAAECMTRNPKSISSGELAVKALALMQQFSITSLVVLRDEGTLAGVIHIHDILKEGIV